MDWWSRIPARTGAVEKGKVGCLDVVAAHKIISDLTYGLNNRNHVHILNIYIYIC